MGKFRQYIIESNIVAIPNNAEPEPGYVTGYRVQNDTSAITKTTGETATEGEGYYICRSLNAAQSLMKMGWGRHILKVQFPKPNKMLQADTLPILWAWQGKNEILFEPVGNGDSFWTKANKLTAKQLGITNDQELTNKIGILTKELSRTLIE